MSSHSLYPHTPDWNCEVRFEVLPPRWELDIPYGRGGTAPAAQRNTHHPSHQSHREMSPMNLDQREYWEKRKRMQTSQNAYQKQRLTLLRTQNNCCGLCGVSF